MFFRKLRCSFCRRDNDHVEKLVAGARGYICDRCAHEVMRILADTPPAPASSTARQPVVLPRASDVVRTWHFATGN
jgi:ATP-dependent protease Clp ATPase subunit